MVLRYSSSRRNDPQTTLEVVGDGCETNLDSGLGQSSPPHAMQAIASLPGAEDLLDAGPQMVDGLFPDAEPRQSFLFVVAPHTGGDDARRATLGADGIAEMAAPISTIGKDIARLVRQGTGTSPAVIDIGERDGDFFDQSRAGIGADMGLEAMDGWPALVLDPARFAILFLSWPVTASNSDLPRS